MPSLPPLPDLTQAQFDKLVTVFTKMSPDPAAAYIQWSLQNLIELVRRDAMQELGAELDAISAQRRAEVEALLQNLIGGG
jgi:predicted oxidoreductase